METFKKKFPCPGCYSTHTVSEEINKILKTHGRLPKSQEENNFIQVTSIPLVNPATAVLVLPSLLIYDDFCWDCGTKYISQVEMKELPMLTTPKQGGMPPRN